MSPPLLGGGCIICLSCPSVYLCVCLCVQYILNVCEHNIFCWGNFTTATILVHLEYAMIKFCVERSKIKVVTSVDIS